MIGGANYHKSQFNLAVQGERQPGSSFKPFVLATALSQGISPATMLDLEAAGDLARRQGLVRPQLRGRIPRADQPDRGDDRVRQHGLRAADADRRAGEHRQDGAPARDHEPAAELLRDRARRRGGQPARDGPRVWRLRERRAADRRPPHGQPSRGDRLGERGAEQPAAAAGAHARDRRVPEPDPPGRRHLRHGAEGGARRPARRGEDRDDGELRRRVVRRLHTAARHRRLGRIPEPLRADAERVPRQGGRRRHVPGRDLEEVHDERAQAPGRPAPGVLGAAAPLPVAAPGRVPRQSDRARQRLLPRHERDRLLRQTQGLPAARTARRTRSRCRAWSG